MGPTPAAGYVHSEAFNEGYLSVSDLHKIWYQEFGKRDGKPVIYVHGGPGGFCAIHKSTAFFDPAIYRVVTLDQRSSGKSIPAGELREWSPDNLVSDLEALRKHLGIAKWHIVFGGSWGSALTMLYAIAHPNSVGSLVLRGVYMETAEEHRFSRGLHGAGRFRPAEYDQWISHLPPEDRDKPLDGYLKLLTCGNRSIEVEAAKAYSLWGSSIGTLVLPAGAPKSAREDAWAFARVECFHHVRFARSSYDHFLGKENLARIAHIPCTIVQGRYDLFCTPRVAYELNKAWPGSRLFWIEDAGHSQNEPGIFAKLVEVCDEYGQRDFAQVDSVDVSVQ